MGKFMMMPKLDMSMKEGRITRWLYKEGDKVEKGEEIVEIETGKVNLEVETLISGTLLKIYEQIGEVVPINEPIAYIGEIGEKIPEISKDDDLPEQLNATDAKKDHKAGKNSFNNQNVQKKDSIKDKSEDLVVIGGGPAGYVAAIRAAQLGVKVTLIEKCKLGGTCLNRGCIPTKSFVKNAEVWRTVNNSEDMGIYVEEARFDWNEIVNRKNLVVNQLVKGVETLIAKNKINLIRGTAKILDENNVSVTLLDGKNKIITTKNIVIATGTVSAEIPIEKDDDVEIMNTDEILNLKSLPDSIAIIGGGVIGVEIASIFKTFGVDVTIVELMPRLIPSVDEEISELLKEELIKSGIKVYTDTGVNKIKKHKNINQLILSNNQIVETQRVLLAVGRKPENYVFSDLNLKINNKGYIKVNEKMQTSQKNIYAIGDVTGEIQLAHVASMQGIVAVENLFGEERVMEYNAVPNCIFTYPEIASVGLTEEEIKNTPYKVSKFPFAGNGKALAIGNTKGFVKIISDSRWDEILGVHIIGPSAADLIAEAALAIKLEATTEELVNTIHAHPTLSEAIMEAAEGIFGKAIHI